MIGLAAKSNSMVDDPGRAVKRKGLVAVGSVSVATKQRQKLLQEIMARGPTSNYCNRGDAFNNRGSTFGTNILLTDGVSQLRDSPASRISIFKIFVMYRPRPWEGMLNARCWVIFGIPQARGLGQLQVQPYRSHAPRGCVRRPRYYTSSPVPVLHETHAIRGST